jgi:putative glutamine amidotransferase
MIVGICSDIIINENCICGNCKGKCITMNSYSSMIVECGFVPIIIPNTLNRNVLDEISKIIDVLLICGNKSNPRNGTIPSDVSDDIIMDKFIHDRDTILVDNMIKLNKKVLGICYGMEFLNSYFGGKIYMNIVKDLSVKSHMKTTHGATITKNTKLYEIFTHNSHKTNITVNSYHYAGVTTEILSNKLVVNTLSDDNLVEGFESNDGNIFGFQYHIEKHPELYFVVKEIIGKHENFF